MRITSENLLKFTQDFVQQRTADDHSILSVYLTGGLCSDDPLWCSVVDVDLVFVHHSPPAVRQEVVPLLPEVYFDIEHHDQALYESTRAVRSDAILAPTVYGARSLYDIRHFFDFVQAGVRSQYDSPEYVYRRAAPLLQQARRDWLGLHGQPLSAAFFQGYLQIIAQGAQSLAVLADALLTPRRFVLQYGRALVALQHEELFQDFLSLLDASQEVNLRDFLPDWLAAWPAGDDERPLQRDYFLSGIQALLDGDMPSAAVWPLLNTWTQSLQSGRAPLDPWLAALQRLGLDDPAARLQALDRMLDATEQILEAWRNASGLTA
ncbi:MAG: hypothetical protein Fur0018_05610 [Anaerolineales bacterium]